MQRQFIRRGSTTPLLVVSYFTDFVKKEIQIELSEFGSLARTFAYKSTLHGWIDGWIAECRLAVSTAAQWI